MSVLRPIPLLLMAGLYLASPLPAEAAFGVPKHPEAPRFEVPEGAQLPLRSTHHDVRVVGPVAHVTLTQTYVNTGESLLDATYIFPGSTGSAVASLVMKVGDRTVRAVLKEKAEARADFEAAKQAGLRASLLEQKRPNVFQMALTNIRPGEKVEVTLGYTELLEPEDGEYELVLPAVVAPRFGGEGEGMGERPTLPSGRPAPAWTADVKLVDGLGVIEVSSPTHSVSPSVDRQGRVQVKVATAGDKELVLKWRLAQGREAAAGLTLFEGEDESFFMMTVAPPKRVAARDIPPREIDFLLDVSCSMRGYPLDVAKEVMRESLGKLRASDRFNIHFFAGSGWTYAKAPVPATRAQVAKALRVVGSQRGGGGTQLVHALNAVAALPRAPGLARTVVVVTDGLVGFEKKAFAEVRKKLDDTTLFTLGIGNNVNRMLVEGLARAGGGSSYVAHDPAGARREADRLLVAIGAPVLTDLQLTIEGLDAYDLEPPTLPTLYADRPVVVVGKYRGSAQGKLRLSGLATNRSFEQTLSVGDVQASDTNAPLRALWARRKLRRVADDRALADGGADKATITSLGLRYGLLTEHTAFVAVDSQGGAAQGDKRSVVQPGAHPAGMARESARSSQYGVMGTGSGGGGLAKLSAAPTSNVFGPVVGGLGHAGRGGIARKRRPPRAPAPTRAPGPSEEKPMAEAEASLEDDARDAVGPATAVGLEILAPIPYGDASAAEVRAAVEKLKPRLHTLYRRAKAGGMALKGRLVVELEVGADGRVDQATVLDASGIPVAMQQDMVKVLRSLRLKPRKAGVKVRLPFRFNG